MSGARVTIGPIAAPQAFDPPAVASFVCRERTADRVLLEADNITVQVELGPGASIALQLQVGRRYTLHVAPAPQ